MKILITGHSQTTDGVSTYIESLIRVLRDNNHYVYSPRDDRDKPKGFDIVFAKRQANYGVPTIIHDHNAIIPSLKYDMYKAWVQKKGRIITVNSEFQKQQLVKVGVEPSRIRWLPNCVDENIFYPRDTMIISKRILYLGRVGENNQNTFFAIMEAMKYLPDYSLNIVGSVDAHMSKMISKRYNLPNVSFVGSVHDSSILAEIISMHSFGIGVGRSAMEMILCGLPVLLFGLGWEGWINERNVEHLHRQANMTTRMTKEVSIKKKVERIRSAIHSAVPLNREKALEVFGLRKNINIYELLFKELINENLQDRINGSASSIGISRI
jgi:glycosyltransferase involved in cell wall biosynthesis